jgi:hypothetical protein
MGIIALLLVIAVVVAKECITPGTLGFYVFRSQEAANKPELARQLLKSGVSTNYVPRAGPTGL